eukprot:3576636-Pleurochrysis_carterae.AAC.1
MVALVAFEVARASTASCRSSSRPLPAQDAVYVRRAARLAMVSRIRFDSSGVSGGGLETVEVDNETEAEVAVAAGAALAPVSA